MMVEGSIRKLVLRALAPVLLGAGLLAVCSCTKNVGAADETERENPEMKRARELESAGDLKAAQKAYESILDRNPTVARAHFELACLLDKTREDHIATIYHFRRYLILRPDTEKRAMIESHIQSATLEFVGTLFTNQAAVLTRMGEVEAENKVLRVRTANLQAQTLQLRNALTLARTKAGGAAEKSSQSVDAIDLHKLAPVPGVKTVKVEKADTLKKLALRYYGDSGRWREIYEANKQKMKSPGDLRVGQMILIPPS